MKESLCERITDLFRKPNKVAEAQDEDLGEAAVPASFYNRVG